MPRVGLAFDITTEDFRYKVEKCRYTILKELKIDAYITKEPKPFSKKTEGTHKTLKIGDTWGDLFDCAWMNLKGQAPKEAKSKHLILLIDLNGEACVFDKQGNPYRGLTTKASEFDRNHGWPTKRVFDITKKATGNEKIDIWLDAGCNDLFGKKPNEGRVEEAYIAIQNRER